MGVETVKPTDAQMRARRNRSIAIGFALAAFVIVVYVASVVRMQPAAVVRTF